MSAWNVSDSAGGFLTLSPPVGLRGPNRSVRGRRASVCFSVSVEQKCHGESFASKHALAGQNQIYSVRSTPNPTHSLTSILLETVAAACWRHANADSLTSLPQLVNASGACCCSVGSELMRPVLQPTLLLSMCNTRR